MSDTASPADSGKPFSLAMECTRCRTRATSAFLESCFNPEACPGCGYESLIPFVPEPYLRKVVVKAPRVTT